MSKQSKQLANAERVADEAIAKLEAVTNQYRQLLSDVEPTYPGHFADDHAAIVEADAEAIRLRAELEGQG